MSRIRQETTGKWTAAENKMFEKALAVYDRETPDRWIRVAAMVPGKTVADVIIRYKELEDDVNSIDAGLIPVPRPGYVASRVEFGSVNNRTGKRDWSGKKVLESERKKGMPWTEEEHKLFLMGLKKYGKGDWRNISRNLVITRTPTQVASHAQKYFLRQISGGKDKRRASIHDITTVDFDEQDIKIPPLQGTLKGFPGNNNQPSGQSLMNMFMNGVNSCYETRNLFSQMPESFHDS